MENANVKQLWFVLYNIHRNSVSLVNFIISQSQFLAGEEVKRGTGTFIILRSYILHYFNS